MIAYYLSSPSAASIDRALGILDLLEDEVVIASPSPAPRGTSVTWFDLGGEDPACWSAWLRQYVPKAVVIDGPDAQAQAARDAGCTVGVVAVPGDPKPFEADVILAPWADDSRTRRSHSRTVHLGAVGRQAWAAAVHRNTGAHPRTWRCVVLSPTAGGPGPRERRDLLGSTPGWQWWFAPEREALEAGPLWSRLSQADVVVCAPTASNLAAVVAAQIPSILVLPQRPTPSHRFLADLAVQTGVALLGTPPTPGPHWRELLTRARTLDTAMLDAWNPRSSVEALRARFADVAAPSAPSNLVGLASV